MREILAKLNRSKSQQLVTNPRHRCSHLQTDRDLTGANSVLSTLDRGYEGEDCYRELPRMLLLGTSVNKGKEKGRPSAWSPFFRALWVALLGFLLRRANDPWLS